MRKNLQLINWLPITRKEMELRGWDEVDIIIISGDAYVDHPGFGHAVISRILEKQGFKVAILPQPNWRDDLRDFKKLGKPRLFFGVTSGCMDSMVNHYTSSRRLRSNDAYTPGGESGYRPDYATVVYSQILKKLYPEVPVIIGGIESSLRRLTHYDYWSDSLKPSILFDSNADLLVYGMGEIPIIEIAKFFNDKKPNSSITKIPQICYRINKKQYEKLIRELNCTEIASHEDCLKNKRIYASNFKIIETESNKIYSKVIIQKTGNEYIVVNPPNMVMNEKQIDSSFDLPYTRLPHPKYEKRGAIPAYEMIKHSVNIHRGCFGGCAFCTISAHQGKFIVSRSEESILKELNEISKMPDFKGYISDLGGPSANMYKMQGKNLDICYKCSRFSCIYPNICMNLNTNHKPLINLYKKAAKINNIKKIFISSGIRYDLFTGRNKSETITNSLDEYAELLITQHVSGRLKVAPEHNSDKVLNLIRKPTYKLFQQFKIKFDKYSKDAGLNQQIIPYYISSHPGCDLTDMALLAIETKKAGYKPEQIQDFTPTPMTLATEIYYSGYHPYTLEKVYCAKSIQQKQEQNRFFFWYKTENHNWIKNILIKLHKEELAQILLPSSKYVKRKKKFP